MPSTTGKFKPNNDYAVVYCRVSSERQATEDKVSLDEQEERGMAKVQQLGLHILYIVKDPESAWITEKRSKFQSVIMADARARKFGYLIVDRPDRFTRDEDLSEPIIIKHQLKDAGVKLVFSDRQYSDDRVGQLMEVFDFWQSGGEQESRRKASLDGKVGRAKRGHPIPGRRPPYGFVWVPDTNNTLLARDPGPAQSVVRQIWDYFLHFQPTPKQQRPSLRGIERILSDAHVPPPRVYQGIDNKKGKMRSMGWCRQSITDLLRDPRYWGEPRPALLNSKYHDEQPPIEIKKTYVREGDAYVTPQEAARVHAMLGWNAEHSGRPPKRDWGTLLISSLLACGYCGKALDPYNPHGPAGPVWLRCRRRDNHGPDPAKGGCSGVWIDAAVLDWATIDALDSNLKKEHFLENIFAAWGRDEGEAADAVRVAKAALDEAQANLDNLTAWMRQVPPDSATGASIERDRQLLEGILPGLRRKYDNAQADITKVRANTALADDLRMWFDAWLDGFQTLPTERQRQFLESLYAKVSVWREDDPARIGLSRAELVIGLPTDVLHLPTPYPPDRPDLAWLNVTVAPDGWHVPLDIASAARVEQAIAAGFTFDNEATQRKRLSLTSGGACGRMQMQPTSCRQCARKCASRPCPHPKRLLHRRDVAGHEQQHAEPEEIVLT